MHQSASQNNACAHQTPLPSSIVLTNAVLFLLLSYWAKFSYETIFGLDPVLVAWAVLTGTALLILQAVPLLLSGVVHITLIALYLIGSMSASLLVGALDFTRNILTSFVFAALTAGCLSCRSKTSISPLTLQTGRLSVKTGICAVGLWTAMIVLRSGEVGGFEALKDFGGANYLMIANLLAVFALLTLHFQLVTLPWRVSFFILTVIALVFLGSRAAMVAFALAAIFFINDGKPVLKRLAAAALTVVAISCVVVVLFETVDESLLRRFASFQDFDSDESRLARSGYLEAYFQRVSIDPGCWFYPCREEGPTYIHNILSVQQYFGLVGTVIILLLFVVFCAAVRRGYRIPCKSLFVYSLFLQCLSHSWVHLTFPIIVGYFLDSLRFYVLARR